MAQTSRPGRFSGHNAAPAAARTARHGVRAALRTGVSVIALAAGLALPGGAALAACAPSSQVITGASGPLVSNGGSISITGTGSVTGQPGVDVGTCPETTIGNAGAISGVYTAVFNSNTIGTLSNSGAISGGSNGVQNYFGTIGTLSNTGTISGDGSGGALRNYFGTIGTLTNSGTITSAGIAAIWDIAGMIGTLTNNGSIGGGVFGILNSSSSTGSGNRSPGSIGTLTNTGSISGTQTAIRNVSGGTIGALTNSGTISGSIAILSTGSYDGINSSIGAISNTGVISGNITIGNQDVTITGGSGGNFGTLTGGNINILNGNLLFGGGNQALGDNITVNGGAGTVTNAGVLRVATPISITGNFTQLGAGVLDLEFAGTGAGQFGKLSITGAATLAGGLAVDLIGGFELSVGDSFDILDYASESGDFSSFALDGVACTSGGDDIWDCSNLGGGLEVVEQVNGDYYELEIEGASGSSAVPEPGTFGLVVAGLVGLGAVRRRRRTATNG